MNLLPVYVVCRSSEQEAAWQHRSLHYHGLDFHLLTGATSYYRVINDIISSEDLEVLVVHDDVWLSIDLDRHISALIRDLSEKYPNWGLCGNSGMRWDGTISARHISDPHGGPIPANAPRPVMSIDGNAMLLNCRKMRESGLSAIPDLEGFHGYDLVLSYETLKSGLSVLIDGRLYTKHDSAGNQIRFADFASNPGFQAYLSQNFKDYRFDTINGPIVLNDKTFPPISNEREGRKKMVASLIEYYDAALASVRKENPVKLAVCVRTQFKRPHLLERLLISAAHAIREAAALISTDITLLTDQEGPEFTRIEGELRERFADIKIVCFSHKIKDGRSSRVDLIYSAFESVQADFLWFIDDDDYVLPSGICNIARSIYDKSRQLIIVDCLRASEKWQVENSVEFLKSSKFLGRTDSAQVYEALRGDNFTPFCGAIYPRTMMREKLRVAAGRTSYYEDYLLLLVALSCSEVLVEKLPHLCCGISIRGADNTVTEKDRTIWNLSLATVLAEVNANPHLAISFAWDIAQRTRENVVIESQRAIAFKGLGTVNGKKIRIGTASFNIIGGMELHGFADRIEFENDELLVAGWAVDVAAKAAVEQIAISINREVIVLMTSHACRLDVASELQLSLDSAVGFKFRIKSVAGWDLGQTPEVFALSRGLAKKLNLSSFAVGEKLRQTADITKNAFSESNFDTDFYLTSHPDVRVAIDKGAVVSAFSHWLFNGSEEGRGFRFKNGIKPTKFEIASARIASRRQRTQVNAGINDQASGDLMIADGKFMPHKVLKSFRGRFKR